MKNAFIDGNFHTIDANYDIPLGYYPVISIEDINEIISDDTWDEIDADGDVIFEIDGLDYYLVHTEFSKMLKHLNNTEIMDAIKHAQDIHNFYIVKE